ncbi:predicted protein [Chaetoceros tenuissimus]|uniref:Uncharacterized protein n=1 Tax=Chaetoceros tenuissimus TaxID=426638 RepID=A0AAD3CF06_9STRA|nr:predicted protein [Chaetoceros tenuissimus]
MTTYKVAIVVGLLKDVANQTNVQQLQQFQSKSLRIRKLLSEAEQSQTFASFMRDMVTQNISYMQEVARKFCPYDNCNVEFEFGDKQCAKVMIRKAGSASAVVSLVITFRTVMCDNSECASECKLCMICHDDTLLSHLACSSSVEELYFVPSIQALPQFSSSFKVQQVVSKVILMDLDENDSLCDFIIDPNFDQIEEFTKNDKEVVSRHTDKSTSSSKSAKRKSTGASDRANKSAKNTETAKAPQTIADTNESPIVETTKESTKKSKTSKKSSSKKERKRKAESTESETTKKSTKKSKTSKKSSSKKEGKRKAAATVSESESEKSNKAAKNAATEENVEGSETMAMTEQAKVKNKSTKTLERHEVRKTASEDKEKEGIDVHQSKSTFDSFCIRYEENLKKVEPSKLRECFRLFSIFSAVVNKRGSKK